MLEELQEDRYINGGMQQYLSTRFNGMSLALLTNEDINMDKKTSRRYSSETLLFAATLDFLSPAAYQYVRKHFALPDKSTLLCHQSVDGEPGWTAESFQAIKEQHANDDCVLIFDAMHLKEHVQFVKVRGGRRAVGYVDIGCGPDDNSTLAKEALVFIAVGVLKAWR